MTLLPAMECGLYALERTARSARQQRARLEGTTTHTGTSHDLDSKANPALQI